METMSEAYNQTQREIDRLRDEKTKVWKLIFDNVIDERDGQKRIQRLDDLIEQQISIFN